MSTPDHPNGPVLTRKKLREMRMTGVTPVIDPDAAAAAQTDAPEAPAPAPAVHLPKAADPAVAAAAPRLDAHVDLGVVPLTRRQAREQERIRTASVPVITPDMADAQPHSSWAPPAEDVVEADVVEAEAVEEVEPALDEAPADDTRDAESSSETDEPAEAIAAEREAPDDEERSDEASSDRPLLRTEFGSELLAGAEAANPPVSSFDDLIARGTASTGSVATPSALILTQSPTAGPLTTPVAATGEVLITGTYELPDGLGSHGHLPGTADGKDVDAVLVDGELPAASSPTPIAASAAISTAKGAEELIRPPAPEKGGKLMLGLAITAGVLAVALVGVLILAFTTGLFR
ncbi:MAG: hypothetical protein QM611_11290 [Microbacterium sp.]|uniref:hypothetical protein n=1 Tax=Microbacterium sp. TaxID=51671 RepID=UPI0039E4D241